MITERRLGVLGGLLVLALVIPSRAWACEPLFFQCWVDEYVPSSTKDGMTLAVPANLPGLDWYVGYSLTNEIGARSASLVKVDGNTETELQSLTVDFPERTWVLFDVPLEEGATYRFVPDQLLSSTPDLADEVCSRSVTLQVGPEAPLPTTLGTITIGEPTLKQYPLGIEEFDTCGRGNDADGVSRTATLTLSDEAKPWKDVLVVRAMLDGFTPWSGEILDQSTPPTQLDVAVPVTEDGTATVDLYEMCGNAVLNGLAPGVHTVFFRGRVLGSDQKMDTVELDVVLNCEDVGRKNGSLPEFDGGVGFDGGSEVDGGVFFRDEVIDGCAVRAPGAGASGDGVALVVLALVGWVVWRRRRGDVSRVDGVEGAL